MLKVLLGSALGATVSWRLQIEVLTWPQEKDKHRTHKHTGKYYQIVPLLCDYTGVDRKAKFKEHWPQIFGCEAENLLGSTEAL